MATVTKPIALDESIHTTDGNDTNIADLMQSGLAAIATAVGNIPTPTASNVSWSGTINGTAVTNVAGALTALNDGLTTNTTLLGSTDISSIGDGTVSGAISTVNSNIAKQTLSVISVTFTYDSYGLWLASIMHTHRIIKSLNPAYLLSGDGTNYVRVLTISSNSITLKDTSDSPFTIDCLCLPQ